MSLPFYHSNKVVRTSLSSTAVDGVQDLPREGGACVSLLAFSCFSPVFILCSITSRTPTRHHKPGSARGRPEAVVYLGLPTLHGCQQQRLLLLHAVLCRVYPVWVWQLCLLRFPHTTHIFYECLQHITHDCQQQLPLLLKLCFAMNE